MGEQTCACPLPPLPVWLFSSPDILFLWFCSGSQCLFVSLCQAPTGLDQYIGLVHFLLLTLQNFEYDQCTARSNPACLEWAVGSFRFKCCWTYSSEPWSCTTTAAGGETQLSRTLNWRIGCRCHCCECTSYRELTESLYLLLQSTCRLLIQSLLILNVVSVQIHQHGQLWLRG